MTDQEKIIERIRKLLALATSNNEHEAALAASKAQELMLKHNLNIAQVDTGEEEEQVNKHIRYQAYGTETWRRTLMGAIADNTLCRFIYGWRDPLKNKNTAQYFIIGKSSNVEVAMYLFDYLHDELERLTPRAIHKSRAGSSFRLGAIAVISRKLRETLVEFREASPDTKALVLHQTAEVENAVTKWFPKLRGVNSGGLDSGAYYAGAKAGEKIQIRRGVTGNRNAGGQHLLN